jgi:hypothetical protein
MRLRQTHLWRTLAGILVVLCVGLLLLARVSRRYGLTHGRVPALMDARRPRDPTISVAKAGFTKSPAASVSSQGAGHDQLTEAVSDAAGSVEGQMPEAVGDEQYWITLQVAQRNAIWKSQDGAMAHWPRYEEFRTQLLEESGIDATRLQLSANDFLAQASALEQSFWQSGGCSSQNSFESIYRARYMMEVALERFPDNIEIMDELVRVIQAAQPLVMFEASTSKLIRQDGVCEALEALRAKQFTIIKGQVDGGRPPTFDDFPRIFDLAVLQSFLHPQLATQTLAWLTDHAVRGEWAGYSQVLDFFRTRLAQDRGDTCTMNIFNAKYPNPADAFVYGRRLPSFRPPTISEDLLTYWGRTSQLPATVMVFEELRMTDAGPEVVPVSAGDPR